MDGLILWAAVGAGALVVFLLALRFAPAKTSIIVDTAASTARADTVLLWGMGPKLVTRALPKSAAGSPLALFNDAPRISHALMTPGIADTALAAYQRLFALKPKVSRLDIGLNLSDSAQNLVVQTAVEASLASAPVAMRETVTVQRCGAPGAEIALRVELLASPATP